MREQQRQDGRARRYARKEGVKKKSLRASRAPVTDVIRRRYENHGREIPSSPNYWQQSRVSIVRTVFISAFSVHENNNQKNTKIRRLETFLFFFFPPVNEATINYKSLILPIFFFFDLCLIRSIITPPPPPPLSSYLANRQVFGCEYVAVIHPKIITRCGAFF